MGASSDPTPLKPGNAGGGKGPSYVQKLVTA